MKELEKKEADEMQRKKEDPYAFELEKQFEEDMENFENIIY